MRIALLGTFRQIRIPFIVSLIQKAPSHAVGHVIGRSTHEIGPLLGPRWPNRYGRQGEKQVQRDMVFTIEPSVTSKFGTSNLEQDVLVRPNGYLELLKPLDEIIQLG